VKASSATYVDTPGELGPDTSGTHLNLASSPGALQSSPGPARFTLSVSASLTGPGVGALWLLRNGCSEFKRLRRYRVAAGDGDLRHRRSDGLLQSDSVRSGDCSV